MGIKLNLISKCYTCSFLSVVVVNPQSSANFKLFNIFYNYRYFQESSLPFWTIVNSSVGLKQTLRKIYRYTAEISKSRQRMGCYTCTGKQWYPHIPFLMKDIERQHQQCDIALRKLFQSLMNRLHQYKKTIGNSHLEDNKENVHNWKSDFKSVELQYCSVTLNHTNIHTLLLQSI